MGQTNGIERGFQPVMNGRIFATNFGDAREGDTVDGLTFDDAEPHLDQVHPRRRGRGEVAVDPQVVLEPVFDRRSLVGGIVVHHQVQILVGVGLGDLF